MRSSFGGLSIGLSGAWAQQRALDITGHNISNVNTPGYARQGITHASSTPSRNGISGNGNVMTVGTGVDVQEIRQYRDYFLDQKLRRENKELGYWNAKRSSVEELETIFNDNSEDGLQAVMDDFWNSWSQLSKPGGGLTARALVKENAIAFVETVKNLDTMLLNYRRNRNNEIKENVDKLNAITSGIASLNYDIKRLEASGTMANDYRDQRDALVDELSKMVNIQITEGSNYNISVEGIQIVSGETSNPLIAEPDMSADGYYSIKWSRTMEEMNINGGSLKALIESRDELIDGFRNRLNEFVKGVAEEVNELHSKGFGNVDGLPRDMFVNSTDNSGDNIDITNIGFNPELEEVNHIAAAKLPPPGNYEDNQNALAISEWRLKDVFSDYAHVGEGDSNAKFNFDEFYRSIITDIGLEGNKAANAAEAQGLLVEQIEYKRQSLMAVSLDEEMSNLIKYEHSYNAAARIVNAMDEMIDIIVNKVGLGGR
ncbi:MAG: flgK [Clostridia bacterium]|jgi:flagellar hook-associated protein 1 FlgK|nr:flgK [Clostridia bacterium]